MTLRTDYVQKLLERIFFKYGLFLAKHPLPFIIIPIIISALLGLGLMNLHAFDDTEALYTPRDGPAKVERKIIQDLFEENDTTSFIPSRRTVISGGIQIILTRKNKGNVYSEQAVKVAFQVEQLIENITVEDDNGVVYQFSSLCAKWKDTCSGQQILPLISGSLKLQDLTYPFYNVFGSKIFLGTVFGGTKVNPENNLLESAEALLFGYALRYKTSSEQKLTDEFLRSFISEMKDFEPEEEEFTVTYFTSISIDEELAASIGGVGQMFSYTYTILSVFAAVSCHMKDQVRSKAWVAMAGEVAAGMAILSALGLFSAVGVPFTTTVASVPFVIIGIGIDDVFVMISSWRHTSYTLPVEHRLAKTFETSAVAITLTSMTDALAFGIGAITKISAVTYFCIYAGVAVVFCYVYALTFSGACLVYSGRIEHKNRHSTMCCIQLHPPTSKEAENMSGCSKSLCVGGDECHLAKPQENKNMSNKKSQEALPEAKNSQLPEGETKSQKEMSEDKSHESHEQGETKSQQVLSEKKTTESTEEKKKIPEKRLPVDKTIEKHEEIEKYSVPFMTKFISKYVCRFILHPVSKAIILLLYVCYLACAIWGCTELKEGLEIKNLALDGSYVVQFYENMDKYFKGSRSPKVMVVFIGPIDYHKPSVQSDIENQLQMIRDERHYETGDRLTESWLKEYLNYLNTTNQDPSNKKDFITILKNQFLTERQYEIFAVDINFNDDESTITSSRFMLQTKDTNTALDERDLMLEARAVAAESKYNIIVFSSAFVYFDQYVIITSSTIQNLGIAVLCMMVVSAVLLPSLNGIIFITLSIMSICTGVIGFMVLWDVTLDSISMINLVMCIGFSVDMSAHISYHFFLSTKPTGNERASEALTEMGFPIIQAAMSTILGVCILAPSSSYILRTFFKLMFLVMVFGFLHAFFLLPVVFALTQSKLCHKKG